MWNDYGNPDRFRFWFDNGDYASGIKDAWKGQRLEDGLPVITTSWGKATSAMRSNSSPIP